MVGATLAMGLGWALVCTVAKAATVPPEIENEQMLGINKEPAHATLMPYASMKEALAANRHASSYCRSLNGPWKFNWVARRDPVFLVSGDLPCYSLAVTPRIASTNPPFHKLGDLRVQVTCGSASLWLDE